MTQSEQRPVVLYRYDEQEDRDVFTAQFADDFVIEFCSSDQAALEALGSRHQTSFEPIVAVFVDQRHHDQDAKSAIYEAASRLYPAALRILLHDEIELDDLVSLLDSRWITHCFKKPYDSRLICSRVFTARLGLRSTGNESLPVGAPPEPTHTATPEQRRYALIVDDEPAATRYLKKQLERMNCRCSILCADNASEAQELLSAHASDVAVIISDQRMPGKTGSQLLNEIRATQPTLVRVLTSAWGEVDVALGAINDGRIFQYLKKPWNADEVLSCIHSALDEHLRLAQHYAQTQSTLVDQHQEIIRARKHRLLTLLSERVQGLAIGVGPLTAFLESLESIDVLPPSASSVRASLETDLEQQLARRIGESLDQKLSSLYQCFHGGKQTSKANRLRQLQHYLETARNPLSDAAHDQDDERMQVLIDALDTLLSASGLTPSALVLTTTPDPRLTCAPGSSLRMYQHLGGPLTTISNPLIQQQTALLLLFILSASLGGALEVTGGRQSFSFSLSFG